uniref:Putative G-protein coupled receptor Mth-like 5 n=3 Tax=Lygus hesperus TaxID=30085 RepID=A0A0A9XMZ4_LYGHE
MELAVLFVLVGSVLSLPPPPTPEVYIGKCCPREEIMLDEICRPLNETDQTEWVPDVQPGVRWVFQTGLPLCGTRQLWPVYHNGSDRLRLLPDGSLRHFIVEDPTLSDDEIDGEVHLYHDYMDGLYCREKNVDSKTKEVIQFAVVCAPEVPVSWKNMDFIMRRIVDPTFHVISIFCYLTAAIIHFILPQLRDMMGNILSTMSVCLAISEAADMICIYTEFTSPSAFLTADFVLFTSLLGAFLWLNSLGFYIWKTSRSHNVFLRITDGKKYCYYSYYVWGWTKVLTVIAIISHFFLDVDTDFPEHHGLMPREVAVGWLGVALFFFPVACTILLDLYFYLSTTQVMNSIIMSEYGHIHHKLKHSNKIFFKIFLIMCLYWSFLLISWLPFNGTYYTFVIGNGFIAPLFLYVSVLNQKRVRFLLKKVCCFENCWFPCCRPDNRNDIPEWGEEMLAMYR